MFYYTSLAWHKKRKAVGNTLDSSYEGGSEDDEMRPCDWKMKVVYLGNRSYLFKYSSWRRIHDLPEEDPQELE